MATTTARLVGHLALLRPRGRNSTTRSHIGTTSCSRSRVRCQWRSHHTDVEPFAVVVALVVAAIVVRLRQQQGPAPVHDVFLEPEHDILAADQESFTVPAVAILLLLHPPAEEAEDELWEETSLLALESTAVSINHCDLH